MPPSIVLTKITPYRGVGEEWTNRYHFDGSNPADAAAWKALSDAVIAKEKLALTDTTYYTMAYGYTADDAPAVWSWNYVGAGQPQGQKATAGATLAPLDCAIWLRWRAGTKLSSKGKPVYLRKYYHGIILSTTQDGYAASQKSALDALGAALIDGTSLPTGRKICGPDGTAAITPLSCSYVTTRTLKRRGKRPH